MASFEIEVRYSRELTDPEMPPREENFGHGTVRWNLETAETGIVLVDCWDKHPCESHLERGGEIARERILPVVEACRKAGIAVIHAPSPTQARMYPQWTKYAEEYELHGTRGPRPEWPPEAFRRREGKYEGISRPVEPRRAAYDKDGMQTRRIMDFLGPEPEDFVVATGGQLHRLCRHQGIVHLMYAGFAANICVQRRDYGVWAMMDRGYNIILLRDCTTAIEHSETWDGMWLTKASVLDMELRGVSVEGWEVVAGLAGNTEKG